MKTLLLHSSSYALSEQIHACHSTKRRRGKVARLPIELRQQINRMLDDGFTYKKVIEILGDAGKHLNEDNVGNWYRGGYQDHIKSKMLTQRARIEVEAAADLVHESGDTEMSSSRLREICSQIALLSYMGALMKNGQHLAQQSLQKNPAKTITLMNTFATMSAADRLSGKQKRLENEIPATLNPSSSEVIQTSKK